MRFETRFDGWLVALIGLGCVVGCASPVIVLLQAKGQGVSSWLMLLVPVVVLFSLFACLPQYYDVREDGLFIRQGRKKVLLPYSALSELDVVNSAFSAPVFSTHRLQVTAVPGGQFLIAVAEQDRFLAEVARHAPQLEQRHSGLKTRSGSPSLM